MRWVEGRGGMVIKIRIGRIIGAGDFGVRSTRRRALGLLICHFLSSFCTRREWIRAT